MKGTFNIRGAKVRTASQRRYVVVIVRPEAVNDPAFAEPLAPFTAIYKRSDRLLTVRDYVRQYGRPATGAFIAIVDTVTGEEVT
jgi:hypothetical protein